MVQRSLLLAASLLAAAAAAASILPAAHAGSSTGTGTGKAGGGGVPGGSVPGGAPLVELPITVPPSYAVKGKDAYVCVVKALPAEPHKLVGVKPLADESVVHHILLYGCSNPAQQPPPGETIAWDCFHHGVCGDGGSEILYGWGRNAPNLALPSNTALSVGNGTNIRFIVAQVHFKELRPANDNSGVMLQLRQHSTLFSTGIITFAAGFTIPPNTKSTKVSIECCYQAHQPITTLAFRVHTHALGRSVTMERQAWNRSGTEVVATNNPLLPQAFYPVNHTLIWPGDKLKVTCDFDSTGRMRETNAGSTSDDEMCNMYMMVFSPHPFLSFCTGGNMDASDDMPGVMPRSGVLRLDPAPFWRPPGTQGSPRGQQKAQGQAQGKEQGGQQQQQQGAAGEGKDQQGAEGRQAAALGTVSGVALGGDGALWAFYRGDHVWTGATFDGSFRMTDPTPIKAPVLVRLNSETGAVMERIGAGLFGMPHMITIDNHHHIWAVDVGLHTVVKMDRRGKVLLTLGTPGQPGKAADKFCQPTHVAVARDGTLYVADGYCNQRVVKYTANGTYIGEVEIPATNGMPYPVVHSVLLDECTDELYVAARECGQVVVVDSERLTVTRTIDLSAKGRLWSIIMGPYGTPLALSWKEGTDGELVDLKTLTSWVIPGTAESFPHQVALGAAPPVLSGAADRLFALYVAPTCERGCGPLQRFVLVPQGMKLPDLSKLKPISHRGEGSSSGGNANATSSASAGDDATEEQQQQQQDQKQQDQKQQEAAKPDAGTPKDQQQQQPVNATTSGDAQMGGKADATKPDSTQPASQHEQHEEEQQQQTKTGDKAAGGDGKLQPGSEQQQQQQQQGQGQQQHHHKHHPPGIAVVVEERQQDPVTHTEFGTIALGGEGGGTLAPRPLHGVGWGARLGAFVAFAGVMAAVVAVLSRKMLKREGALPPSGASGGVPKGRKPTIDELLARSAELEGLEEGSSVLPAAAAPQGVGGNGSSGVHSRGGHQGVSPVLLGKPEAASRTQQR